MCEKMKKLKNSLPTFFVFYSLIQITIKKSSSFLTINSLKKINRNLNHKIEMKYIEKKKL